MRHGLFIAPFDELADARLLAELAARAEAAGWDGFFLWDHIHYPEAVSGVADVWTALAAVAMRTERLALGPLVTPLARRRPWVLARQAATLDRLSGGRLVLGLGIGGDTNGEMAEFGEPGDIRERAAMLDEGLELLDAIFSGTAIEHRGEHYAVSARPFLPRPAQARIPIWLGIRRPAGRPLARAATRDGVFPLQLQPGELPALRERLAALRPVGAAPCAVVAMDEAGADPRPWEEAGADWLLARFGPEPLPGDAADEMPATAALEATIEAGPGGRLS
jgi:alkanesulfonate monooxygenase SsuD/methylene tetrahydromethanopterin reductase-like flavin-dependent oxidoreductase (luciferase family)